MSEAKLTLFYGPGSSSMAPHIALWEVGATFSAKLISFAREEQRSPAYLAINPAGKVPTLLVDEQPLTEVAAILFYLAERYPDAQLLPDEPLERAFSAFLAAVLEVTPAAVIGPELAPRLRAAGVEASEAERAAALLEEASAVRYGGGDGAGLARRVGALIEDWCGGAP